MNKRMEHLGTVRSVIRELFEYGNQRKALLGEDRVFDYSLGNPSVPTPEKMTQLWTERLREVPAERLHGYTSAPGAMEARKAVAQDLCERGILHTEASLVYMACGAAAALSAVLSALLEPGQKAAVLSPYFPEYKVFTEQTGATLTEIPCDKVTFQADEAALENGLDAQTQALIINSPNNPTGAVLTEESLRLIARVLKERSAQYGHRIYLVSDEPYRELSYVGRVPSPGAFYPHTVVCYSFSKSLSLPGERIGYCAVSSDADEAQRLFSAICGAGRSLGYVCAPALMQSTVPEMLRETSDFGVYRQNRDVLYRELSRMGFDCVMPGGAFYLFFRADGVDGDTLSEKARAHELLLVPGAGFGSPDYVRIAYCVTHEMVLRSLPAFEALARELQLSPRA